jgi:hypothetical protein
VKTISRNDVKNRIKIQSGLYFAGLVASAELLANCATYKDPELKAIQARSTAAVSELVSKDPKLVKRVKAELAEIRADLRAYAKANNLPLRRLSHKEPKEVIRCEPFFEYPAVPPGFPGPNEPQDCTLTGFYFNELGETVCEYTCVPAVHRALGSGKVINGFWPE